MTAPNNSAAGTAIHIPISPIILGKIKIEPTIKIKVLAKEIMAEVLPSEKAVNIADEKIPKPIITKANEYMEKP